MVCVFMPMEQRVVIGGLDFGMLRLSTLARHRPGYPSEGEIPWTAPGIGSIASGAAFGEFAPIHSLFYVLRVGPTGIPYRLGRIIRCAQRDFS